MNWTGIRYFLASMRTKSFNQAADSLLVKQSTVSRQIASLEEELGGSLFHRTSRGLVPTELAYTLLPHAEAAEHHVIQMEMISKGVVQNVSGVVRIAVVPSMARELLLPVLPLWREKYPERRFELIVSVHSSDMIRGEAVIAIRFFRPAQGDLVVKKVATLSQGVMATRQYLEAFSQPYTPELFDWIALDMKLPDVPESRWYETYIHKEPVLRTNDYSTMVEAVRRGLGVAMMSRITKHLDPMLEDVALSLPVLPAQEVWLVTQRTLRDVPRVNVVWRALQDLFSGFF